MRRALSCNLPFDPGLVLIVLTYSDLFYNRTVTLTALLRYCVTPFFVYPNYFDSRSSKIVLSFMCFMEEPAVLLLNRQRDPAGLAPVAHPFVGLG